jgi:hypothetical protein
MFLHFTERESDSPLVERIWTSRSDRAGAFLSVAACHVEFVVTRHRGSTFATLRGPETRASHADCPADGEWVAIRFSLGTFLPVLPPAALRDRSDSTLPPVTGRSFLLDGSVWEYPTYENAETFVARLAQRGLVVHDDAVDRAMHGLTARSSVRSVQRHFRKATGLSYQMARQIERARHATNLLRDGASILDTVARAGYYDQAHLTRSLTHYIGQTPGDIVRARQQLSFLYKTSRAADS